MGSALGFILAFTNLYAGLKTGWHLGVAITACVLSYTIWNKGLAPALGKTRFSILENNCMQSTASSAGYSTGGIMVSAIPAMMMLFPEYSIPWPVLMLWVFCLAVLGVVMAIPMKRNMINQEKLRFPSGTAAAVTLQSLYSESKESLAKSRALFVAGAVGLLVPFLFGLKVRGAALLPSSSKVFDWLPGISAAGVVHPLSAWTVKLDHSILLIAAGALVGLRITAWMMIGGLALALFVGPMGMELGAVTAPKAAWKEIGVWVGAPILVASGLLAFLLNWGTIVRAFKGLLGGAKEDERISRVEVPFSWFAFGVAAAGLGIILVASHHFNIPPLYGALAVLMTFFLALVACRATGESDITPTGAMGKIMQLTFGVLIPQDAKANLMTAGITSGAAGASADLLNDLKSGYLLGANPRRQFIAQFMGIFSGTVATVLGFKWLIPDGSKFMGDDPEFVAPAAVQWKAVAEVFMKGLENLHGMAQQAILVGLVIGAVLMILEKMFPKKNAWVPSATGIGLGFILPFYYPLAMFLGAFAAWLAFKKNKEKAEIYTVPLACGAIAGESISGVVVSGVNNLN